MRHGVDGECGCAGELGLVEDTANRQTGEKRLNTKNSGCGVAWCGWVRRYAWGGGVAAGEFITPRTRFNLAMVWWDIHVLARLAHLPTREPSRTWTRRSAS